MIFRKKNLEKRKERCLTFVKLALFSMLLFLFSSNVNAQDSIPAAADFTEETALEFQQFFFKALSEKAIGNYQKALENLESCNQILSENTAVFFEFSKNYLKLNNTPLAKEYINRAIEKDAENIWMQKHLVKVFVKERNFEEAIHIQKKIAALKPKEREYLAKLYLQNRDYKSALSLMTVLENENMISSNLKKMKNNLEKRKKPVAKKQAPNVEEEDVFQKFKRDKSYILLKQVLEQSKNDSKELLKFSNEGLALFPAQPFVYLMNGKALNAKKEYQKALETLKNGFDFVVEDAMEADFYNEMIISYKGLGNKVEEKKYRIKAKKLKI